MNGRDVAGGVIAKSINIPSQIKLAERLVEQAGVEVLTAIGVALVARLPEVAKVDPVGAEKVATAVYNTFVSMRRETPIDLSELAMPTRGDG